MAKPTEAELGEVLNTDAGFRYRLLDRMRSDCEYALKANSNKHLWAENDPEKQIAYMKALYESFPDDAKPEWINEEKINQYAVQLGIAVRAVVLPVGEPPQVVYFDKDNLGSEIGNQVGGIFSRASYLGDKGMDIFINDNAIALGLDPNRAFFATNAMERRGAEHYSDFGGGDAKEGELYWLFQGNVVITGAEDIYGNTPSLTDEQVAFAEREFADPDSGWAATVALVHSRLVDGHFVGDPVTRSEVDQYAQIIKESREDHEMTSIEEVKEDMREPHGGEGIGGYAYDGMLTVTEADIRWKDDGSTQHVKFSLESSEDHVSDSEIFMSGYDKEMLLNGDFSKEDFTVVSVGDSYVLDADGVLYNGEDTERKQPDSLNAKAAEAQRACENLKDARDDAGRDTQSFDR